MENASNALIMAGSVLIGVILLTTMVFVFRAAGDFAKSVDQETRRTDNSKI